jgi:hypothetical protein
VGFPERTRTSRFANHKGDLAGIDDAGIDEAGALHVVKTHDLPADAANLLLARSPRIVITIRDPRDCVTSLMQFQHYGFEQAGQTIAKSARFAQRLLEKSPDALVLRFEDRFTESPDTILRIAEHLAIPLAPGAAAAILAAHQRSAVEGFIAKLPTDAAAKHDPASGDWYDPATQWHKHHAGRDGEIGRWKRLLLPGQPAAIEADCGPFMDRFGYPRAPLHQPSYRFKMGGFKLDI